MYVYMYMRMFTHVLMLVFMCMLKLVPLARGTRAASESFEGRFPTSL